MASNLSKDPFGAAILSYSSQLDDNLAIEVMQEGFESDEIPVPYLFRSYNEMPPIEQKALDLCKGTVLDVGACAGCHSKVLIDKGLEVDAIDISKGSIDYLKQQSINAYHKSIFEFQSDKKYDTILMLMNGIGIAGNISGLENLLKHLKTLLSDEGQIIIDSSDLKYLYEEEDGSFLLPLGPEYYGECKYNTKFKDQESGWFPWLFIDFDTLSFYAEKHGYKSKIISQGEHFDYLASLTL